MIFAAGIGFWKNLIVVYGIVFNYNKIAEGKMHMGACKVSLNAFRKAVVGFFLMRKIFGNLIYVWCFSIVLWHFNMSSVTLNKRLHFVVSFNPGSLESKRSAFNHRRRDHKNKHNTSLWIARIMSFWHIQCQAINYMTKIKTMSSLR